MPEAKTTEQRALAAISNKIDECSVRLEHVEALLKRLAPPPARKETMISPKCM
jgi:hypothetical protein